ncbi:MAG TPA: aminotransferase class V-fold PLP-dependent enzyme [Candidatus Acidoferrales bacterium]|nr:aminotransferase class V-fold PLP-dependent enzyme [Candidatus Acidoferrales bacterium]
MLNRRELLGQLVGTLGATAALPQLAWGVSAGAAKAQSPAASSQGLIEQVFTGPQPAMPSDALFSRDPEAYWAELRKQWIFRPGFLYLNNGTVGSSPRPILRAYIESILHEEQMESSSDPELYPLWGYGPWDEYRKPVADFVGANLNEIALVRNATEGLNYVANGLDLKAGDEVIYTDEEHGSGKSPWLMKQKRYGVVVKEITLPKPPASKQQILDLFEAARTPRTRVVMASHITTMTGCVLPVKEICAWARQNYMLSFIDGAHVIGQFPINLHDIGCDFYITTPHKWLLASKGIGIFYVREGASDQLWNTIATGGWDDYKSHSARLMQFGSTSVSILAGLTAAIDFWRTVGPDRIERRIRELHAYVKKGMGALPGAVVQSGPGPEFTAGICAVDYPGFDRLKFEQWAYQNHQIRTRGTSPSRFRISTHIYHNRADLDRFTGLLAGYRKTNA